MLLWGLSPGLDLLDHEEGLENPFLIFLFDFFLQALLDLELVEDHTGDVTGLLFDLGLVKGLLELDEALHLHIEALNLEVDLEVQVWDGALLHQLDNIDIVLNAGLEVGDLIFELLLLYLYDI